MISKSVSVQNEYPGRWPSFWKDLLGMLAEGPGVVDMFCRILIAIDDDVISLDISRCAKYKVRGTVLLHFRVCTLGPNSAFGVTFIGDALGLVVQSFGSQDAGPPCPALPCPALPCPALPCPALPGPCPALPCSS